MTKLVSVIRREALGLEDPVGLLQIEQRARRNRNDQLAVECHRHWLFTRLFIAIQATPAQPHGKALKC